MIILDSCVIRGLRLDGSDVEVLRAITATKTESVGAPWMAVEELAAQKALEYLEAHKAAASALRKLQNKSHKAEPALGEPVPEGVRERWRMRYANFLEVLPTSDNALREGVYREANILPPATTKGEGDKRVKVGARDVAIWLTAVEYARDHPDETVYFVSNNHRDFTKGDAGYPWPMNTDIADLGDRFVHLTNLAELLETVAPKVEVDVADVRGLLELQSKHIAERATTTWGSLETRSHFEVTTQSGEHKSAQGWLFPTDVAVQLLDVRDVEAYRLGDDGWYVATARWQFVGPTVFPGALAMVACTWETRILAPLRSGDEHVPIIIKGARPQAADVSGIEWPPFPRAMEVTQAFIQAAEAEGRKPTWVEVLLGALISIPALQANAELASKYPALIDLPLQQNFLGLHNSWPPLKPEDGNEPEGDGPLAD
ncbi:PIN domain-containing protein [Streptomyces zaomyceticus]|uniref:PIN domain-containing protein n=1 Tax=Streptomyces zaomyceticus TaxID=68286 RepID=UPI002E0F4AFD|nr:PIN domain-containing protein [Streptomyces zaomyceticus]